MLFIPPGESAMYLLLTVLAQTTSPGLARDGGNGFDWIILFNPAVVWVFIPIVAILVGAIAKIVQRSQEHRERMAMIAAGMHPDYPSDDEELAAESTTRGKVHLGETAPHRPL
jgi:hypothetical protein